MNDFMDAGSQDELQNTISMFEQILEVMPTDQLALRTLYKAYLQLDDRAKAFDRLNRLADALLEDKEVEDLYYLIEQYKLFLDYDKEVALARLEALQSLDSGGSGADAGSVGLVAAKADSDLDQEMGLAWRLFQEEMLTQEDYSNLLTDLTESSSQDILVPVTVLHVLHDRGFKHIARVMHYISGHTGAPFMSLSGFELDEQISGLLPLGFMQKRAALPFGRMGNELMIAVLNPFNEELKRDVEIATGCKCHVYLVDSAEYDLMLTKMASLLGGG